MPRSRDKLRALIAEGWRAFYSEIFGAEWVNALAPHHCEAIEWHWDSRGAFLTGQRPEYFAYFPIWPRGHQKTTIAERVAVVDGMLSLAFGQPGFCLFIGREKHKVKENISNIEALLSSPKVKEYAPELSQIARNDETNTQRQWTATFLHTNARYVYKGGSIESAQAGSRIEQTRPTLQVFDDIDGREDSVAITEMRFNRLTGEIIPMRQANTLAFFAQNLISRFSVMYRIQSQQVQVLVNRKPTEPIPAVIDLETEQRTDPKTGLIRDYFVSGTSTWDAWDEQRIQDEIDSEGLPAFLREAQHEVQNIAEGLVLHAFSDDIHVISESEFDAAYGRRDAWKQFHKVPFSDWARTKTERHANIGGYLCTAPQSVKPELAGLQFYVPFSFPANSMPEDVAERFLSELTPYAYGNNGDRVTWRQLIDDAHLRANAETHFTTLAERVDYERSHLKRVIPQYSRPVLKTYRVGPGAMSHSEDTVRAVFNDVFGFNFEPSNPRQNPPAHVEDINNSFRVNWNVKHPFREAMGYTRTFIIAPDDATADAVNGIYPPRPYPTVIRPDELHDSELMRFQFANLRFSEPVLSSAGESVDRILKINDDFFQGIQMIYDKGLAKTIRLSSDEMTELTVNPQFREEAIERAIEGGASDEDISRMRITRQAQIMMPKVLKGKKAGGRFSRFKR